MVVNVSPQNNFSAFVAKQVKCIVVEHRGFEIGFINEQGFFLKTLVGVRIGIETMSELKDFLHKLTEEQQWK